MDNQPSQTEQIVAYLGGTMSPEELAAFEARLQQDAALAQEVTLHREVGETLSDTVEPQLADQLQAIGKEYSAPAAPVTSPPPRKLPRWIWAAAAAVALIAAFFIFSPSGSTSGDDSKAVFAEVFKPYPALQSVRAEDDSGRVVSSIETAMRTYEAANYAEAIPQFQQIVQEDPAYTRAQFYLGNSYLVLKKNGEALDAFDIVLSQPSNVFHEQAAWYKALAYWQDGSTWRCKGVLKDIQAGGGSYAQAAGSLLEKL